MVVAPLCASSLERSYEHSHPLYTNPVVVLNIIAKEVNSANCQNQIGYCKKVQNARVNCLAYTTT